MKKTKEPVEFLDGCFIEKDYFFLSARLDSQPLNDYDHGRVKWFDNGRWYYQDREWQVSSVCVLTTSTQPLCRSYVALEQGTGIVGFYKPGSKQASDEILPGAESGHGMASMIDIAQVGSSLYLCGYSGRVMRRVNGTWTVFNQGLKSMTFGDFLAQGMTVDDALEAAGPTQRGMRAIDGFSEEAVFCVGRVGLIFRCDGTAWHQIESPTNVDLNCVHCSDDGFVYTAGNRGVLIRGKGNNFHALDTGINDDFYALTSFNGELYVGGLRGIYILKNHGLTYVETGQGNFKCRALDSGADQLLVVAKRWLLVFDGTHWKRLDDPHNI